MFIDKPFSFSEIRAEVASPSFREKVPCGSPKPYSRSRFIDT